MGEDELAAGKVKIKEMGLPDGHPEKEGVLIDLATLVDEVRGRIAKKQRQVDGAGVSEVAQQMESTRV